MYLLKLKKLLIGILLVSNISAQDILFITPTQGLQGQGDLNVTLVASGVNFTDMYSNPDVYFSGNGLNASNEQAISTNTLEFKLDIENQALIGDYTIYLYDQDCVNSWNCDDWTVSEDNVFTVFENTSEIVSISPNSIQAGDSSTLTINGYNTNWDNNTLVNFNLFGTNVNSILALSNNILIVDIEVNPFADNGWHSIEISSNGVPTFIEEGIFITAPEPMEILSVTPNSALQGTNDLVLNFDISNSYINFPFEIFNSIQFDQYAGSNNGTYVYDIWDLSSDYSSLTGTIPVIKIELQGDFGSSSEYLDNVTIGGHNFGDLSSDEDGSAYITVFEGSQNVSVTDGFIEYSFYVPGNVDLIGNTQYAWSLKVTFESYLSNNLSIFFSGDGIDTYNTLPISDHILQTHIDVNSWADLGLQDITIGISDPSGQGEWIYDILEGGFNILPSSFQLLSVSPSITYPSTNNLLITLIGENTNWLDNNPELFIQGSGWNTDWLNVENNNLIYTQIDILSSAITGFRNISVISGEQIVGIENGLEIRNPEIISLNPNIGVQSQQDLNISLIAGGVNFYDIYSYISQIYFSGSGLDINNYIITSPSTINFQLDIDNDATPEWRDIHLIQNNTNNNPIQISKFNAFSVFDSDSVVWGCLEIGACNYNPSANISDDSCVPDTDNDTICDDEDVNISLLNDSYPNATSEIIVQINLEVYSNISGIQFIIEDPYNYLSLYSSITTLDGFSILGVELPDGSAQITLYSTIGQLIPHAFNDIICELQFEVTESIVNTQIQLDIENTLLFDEFSNLVTVNNQIPGLILFGMIPEIGDINQDGEINVADVVTLVQFILGNYEFTPIQEGLADLNQDGELNVVDIVNIINIILGSELNRGNSPNNIDLSYNNNYISIESDGKIAGIQLEYSGNILFNNYYLPDDWEIFCNNNTILIYSMEGSDLNNSKLLDFTGNIEIISAIGSGWNGEQRQIGIMHLPTEYVLHPAYPNPFNPTTTIRYGLPEDSNINIIVYDIEGRLVKNLEGGVKKAGNNKLEWNAEKFPSGVYFVKLIVDDPSNISRQRFTQTQKLMLLK